MIATSIIELANSKKTDKNDVVISSSINHGDSLNEKAISVNTYLHRLCQEYNIGFVGNSNISFEYLQKGGRWGDIHLNESDVEVFKCKSIDTILF